MIKRLILSVLAITAIPAVIMSFPVWADDDLSITLTGSVLGEVTRFQVYNAVTYSFVSYPGPFIEDQVIHHKRTTDVLFKVTYQDETKECTVRGQTSNIVPLIQNEEILEAVTVTASVENNNFTCVTTLPTPSVSDMHMIVDTDEDVDLPTALSVTDFNSENNVLGYTKEYPVSTDSALAHPIYLDSAHSTIDNEAYVCKFIDGTDKVSHNGTNDTKVYISLLESSCVLSLVPPDDGGNEPPPPPPPTGIAINDCASLANIKNNLTADYYLAKSLSGCSPTAIPGVFKGSLDGQSDLGYSISNSTITPNDSNNHAGLFEQTEGAEFKNLVFNNMTVGGEGTGLRGLIVGLAKSTHFSNITVNTLTVGAGDSKNISASGGIAGRSDFGTVLSNVHINGANIFKNTFAGGLIGRAYGGTKIEKSSVRGFSSGTGKNDCKAAADGDCAVGGLIGAIQGESNQSDFDVYIIESSAKGEIKTQKQAGGLVGFIAEAKAGGAVTSITNSYAIVDILEVSDSAGGLIGSAVDSSRNDIYLKYVYAAGEVNLSNANKGKGIIGGKDGSKKYERVTGSNSMFDYQGTGQDYSGDEFSTKENSDVMKPGSASGPYAGWPAVWEFVSGNYPILSSDPESK